jgi:Flp pilus assembly protein protease CpaA
MVTTALLLTLVAAATVTDLRWRTIYNWNTYLGILLALGLNTLATLLRFDAVHGTADQIARYGFVGLIDSLCGLALCGSVMLACYVFFAGGIGGGDVKLIAMTGAAAGVREGLEIMLWAFVFGGALALIILIWQLGPVTLLKRVAGYAVMALRYGKHATPAEEDRRVLKSPLYLAPSVLLAVLIVRCLPIDWF